jgi:hypothetical protein
LALSDYDDGGTSNFQLKLLFVGHKRRFDTKTLLLGIKRMIARLVFKLLVGNWSILCEMLRLSQLQLQIPPETSVVLGATMTSMGPRRLQMIRRAKAADENDMTFRLVDRVLKHSSR